MPFKNKGANRGGSKGGGRPVTKGVGAQGSSLVKEERAQYDRERKAKNRCEKISPIVGKVNARREMLVRG